MPLPNSVNQQQDDMNARKEKLKALKEKLDRNTNTEMSPKTKSKGQTPSPSVKKTRENAPVDRVDQNMLRNIMVALKTRYTDIYKGTQSAETEASPNANISEWESSLTTMREKYSKDEENKAYRTFIKSIDHASRLITALNKVDPAQSFSQQLKVKTAKYKSIYLTTVFDPEKFEIDQQLMLLIPTHMKSRQLRCNAATFVTHLKYGFKIKGPSVFDEFTIRPTTELEWQGGVKDKLIQALCAVTRQFDPFFNKISPAITIASTSVSPSS
jgi:hypothetical protein